MAILRGVRNLLIANVAIFILELILPASYRFEYLFGLVPSMFFKGYVYQVFTYMFLHGGFMHIFFNMYALWLFGSELEYYWGTKEFYRYYFITGIGAGLIYSLFNLHSQIPVIGASGAIFGLLLAYGMLFPNRRLIIFPLFIPIKAIYFVWIYGGIEFILIFTGGGHIAHLAHLGGIAVGYLYLRWKRRRLY